jgi:predicted O-methyltransferase YrrM
MEHFYQNIQNWFDYQDVFKLAIEKAEDNSHFVEIGVWKGGSTAFMGVELFNSDKKIKFDAIDTFEGSVEHGDVKDWLFKEATENLKPVKDVVNIIKAHSLDVVNNYKDDSLDFIFIDGSHEYKDVIKDLIAWYPKVKSGGMFCGHDYDIAWPGVKQAVDEFLKEDFTTIRSTFIHYKK